MDREILFHGKRTDNGEWVEGFYYKDIWGDNTEYIIYDGEDYAVIPETVGQYTELTDKNGRRIFEGDIVKLQSNHTSYYIVEWYKCQWIFRYITRKTEYYPFDTIDDNFGMKNGIGEKVEVVANIHDTPELLELSE